jgi:hypothetical protein
LHGVLDAYTADLFGIGAGAFIKSVKEFRLNQRRATCPKSRARLSVMASPCLVDGIKIGHRFSNEEEISRLPLLPKQSVL